MWSDVFPEELIPRIIDLIFDTWHAFPSPKPTDYEVPITRRFKVALKNAKDLRRLPLRIEREPAEDDPTTAAELGRIDLKFSAAGSAREEVYFAFECKRLYPIENGKRRARAAEYITEGMIRFTTGQYSSVMHAGGMIGYVLDGHCEKAIAAVEVNFITYWPAPRIRRGPLAETEQHDRWIEDQNAREAQPRLPGRGGRRQLRRNHIPAQHVDNPNSVRIKKA